MDLLTKAKENLMEAYADAEGHLDITHLGTIQIDAPTIEVCCPIDCTEHDDTIQVQIGDGADFENSRHIFMRRDEWELFAKTVELMFADRDKTRNNG